MSIQFNKLILYYYFTVYLYFSDKGHSAQSHLEFRIQELTDENHRLNERIEGDSNLLQKNHNIM